MAACRRRRPVLRLGLHVWAAPRVGETRRVRRVLLPTALPRQRALSQPAQRPLALVRSSDRLFDHFLRLTENLGESLVDVGVGDSEVRREQLYAEELLVILLAAA